MTAWTFFGFWLFLMILWLGLSYAWGHLRTIPHPINHSLDLAFAGRRRVVEYALVVGIALLLTWGAWALSRPLWSEPTAPIHPGKPVVVDIRPRAQSFQ
jgi:hypothetical protein